MLALFLLSVSVCLKYTESCSVLPVYRDLCDREVSPCLGRGSVKLRCSVDDEHSSGVNFQWFNASTLDLTTDESAPYLEPNPDLQGSEVSISSEGYWWCRVTLTDANTQLCSSVVPAVHFYPCSCSPAGFETLRTCPPTDRACDVILRPRRCQAVEAAISCLTTTILVLPVPVSSELSVPVSTTTVEHPATTQESILISTGVQKAGTKSTHVVETKVVYTVQTWSIPYQTTHTHRVTTTQTKPSGTPAVDKADNTSGSNSGSVVQLLYIVGPIVAVIVVSIIVVLVGIGCLHHRRKNYRIGERRQSNSRRTAKCNGYTKEEHIYDTVVLAKRAPPSRYTTHTKVPCAAAEYEVPMCKKQAVKPISCEKNECYSVNPVNPVYLEVYGNGQVPVTSTE